MKKILVVDDDQQLRSYVVEVLAAEGYEMEEAGSGKEAIVKIRHAFYDVVLLDFMMPGMSGLEVLMELKKVLPRPKVIMITAFATVENAVDAIKKGAAEYLIKPFKLKELVTTVARVLEEARFEEGVKKLEVDQALSSVASPIRRTILTLLQGSTTVRLMDLTRSLGIEDHTKVVFHLKILREAGMVQQNEEKSYMLTREGVKMVEYLRNLEQTLFI